jgi:hypothetical protein
MDSQLCDGWWGSDISRKVDHSPALGIDQFPFDFASSSLLFHRHEDDVLPSLTGIGSVCFA